MNDYSEVWDDLRSEEHQSGLVYRRVLPHSPHDVFLHREKPSERRRVEISISGVAVGESVVNGLTSAGIKLAVQYKTPQSASLSLIELTAVDSPQFDDLVSDLLGGLAAEPGDGAVARLISRAKAWFRFFELTGHGMGADRAAGLFAELTVLRCLLQRGLPPSAAVDSWVGVENAAQDFHFPHGAIEVKSDRKKGTGKLVISSELQLDTTGVPNLIVALFQIDQRALGSGSTISDLADDCLTRMKSDMLAYFSLQSKLLTAGFDVNKPEKSHHFNLRTQRFYRVTDGFPKLTAENIPIGVSAVGYTIDCSALSAFELDQNAALTLLGV